MNKDLIRIRHLLQKEKEKRMQSVLLLNGASPQMPIIAASLLIKKPLIFFEKILMAQYKNKLQNITGENKFTLPH